MTLFWTMAGLAAALAGWIILTLARRGADPVEAPVANAELAELERLRARGLLADDAFTAARAEAARRLLGAPAPVQPTARPTDPRWVLAGVALTIVLALGLYYLTGKPGLPDAPYERRVDEWAQSLDTLEAPQIAAVAARIARDNPKDRQALTMLGAARFQAGDSIGAASAFRRALQLDPDDPQSWARLGESLVRSQDGEVGADAEAAFREALKRDPNQLGARYFLGEAALKRGDTSQVQAMWSPLIAALDPRDPRRADLERRLPRSATP